MAQIQEFKKSQDSKAAALAQEEKGEDYSSHKRTKSEKEEMAAFLGGSSS